MPQKVCGAATQDSANERNKSNSAISGMSNVHHYKTLVTMRMYVHTYIHTYIHLPICIYYIYI